jgi:hypothetical protein
MNRAQRRRLKKKNKSNEKLVKKMESFGHRPDACSTCDALFDKKSKQHALTWRVVVRENPSHVSLFCPQCIEITQGALNVYINKK